MTHAEIVKTLIGPTSPVGCSQRDKQRLENLNSLGDLLHELVSDLSYIARESISHEASVKEIGMRARYIMDSLSEDLAVD